VVREQGFQWSKPEKFMLDVGDDAIALGSRKREILSQQQIFRESRNLRLNSIRRQQIQLRQIHFGDYCAMQSRFNLLEGLITVKLVCLGGSTVAVGILYVSFS
jgi:hypothetical protein